MFAGCDVRPRNLETSRYKYLSTKSLKIRLTTFLDIYNVFYNLNFRKIVLLVNRMDIYMLFSRYFMLRIEAHTFVDLLSKNLIYVNTILYKTPIKI